MDRIVEEAISKIQELEQHIPNGKHVVTGDIRKLSSKLFRQIKDKNIEHVIALCEELLNQQANRLMLDEHDLVLKGYGWMLKVLSQVDQRCVMEYLIKNHERMPRVVYRYALEKFDKETRNKLMKMK